MTWIGFYRRWIQGYVYIFTHYSTWRVADSYFGIRRKELKSHAKNNDQNMFFWACFDSVYPILKPLMEEIYWKP